MPTLHTLMSPVMARYPTEGVDGEATLRHVELNGRPLYWLDEMLGGGLELPDDVWATDAGSPSFVLLLGGPPGTGKTTFALELCHNLVNKEASGAECPWNSLYVSAETPGGRIAENANRFGWKAGAFKVLSREDPRFDPEKW